MAAAKLHPFLLLAFALPLLAATHRLASAAPSTDDNDVRVLVRSRAELTPEVIGAIAAKSVRVAATWPEIRTMAVLVHASKLDELASHSMVERLELDRGASFDSAEDAVGSRSTPVPAVTSTTPIQTWNQDMADTQGSSWTGAGVTVAVVDAGLPQNWQEFLPPGCVDLEHAVGFGAEGWGDYHAQTNAIRGVGGHIGQFPHGLAVSSVIVGFPSELGPIAGAAPGARILPVRVLNQFNFGWISWFTAGILHVAKLKASGAIPGPLVINFSIQIGSSSPTLKDAIDYAIAQGVVFVTIAGNFNPQDVVSFPGRLPEAITAAAAGWRSEGLGPAWFFGDVPEGDASQVYVAPFSGREPASAPAGSQIDVVAPGSFVFGEWAFGPGFSEGRSVGFDAVDNFIFGTSFAAPHVAGIVAQMLQKNPTLDQAAVEHILRDTALPLPPSPAFLTPMGIFVLPWDARATGAGLVQGAAAVAATPTPSATAGAAMAARSSPATLAARGVELRSRTGSIPVEIEWAPLARGSWTVTVADVQGRVVRRWSEAGRSSPRIAWDGVDEAGSRSGPGVYFIRLAGPDRSATARVVVLPR